MKKYLLLIIALVSFSIMNAQEIQTEKPFNTETSEQYKKGKKGIDFKKIFNVKKFFKYSTIYGIAGEAQPQTSTQKTYYVDQGGELYDITPDAETNYSYGFGIRKVARFDYENKPNAFYDGTEIQTGLSSNVGAVQGWEYKFQWEWARQFGNEYTKEDLFIRHLGKHHIFKLEQLQDGLADLDYRAVDLRWRKAIGSKLNLSVGAAFRTHRPYGYLPIADYLDDNPWWQLAYDEGFVDNFYGIDYDNDGELDNFDYYWTNPEGERVSDTDLDFRNNIFGGLVNDFNRQGIALVEDLGTISAVIGLDFYHYSNDGSNWVHVWGSVLPYHKHVMGEELFSYGKFINEGEDAQWVDYTAGIMTGWKITKRLGIFAEMNYLQYWDRQVFTAKGGINFQFR